MATFRFYEELNDFLPQSRQKVAFEHHFARRASIKDMIESFGVPHTEVESGDSIPIVFHRPSDRF